MVERLMEPTDLSKNYLTENYLRFLPENFLHPHVYRNLVQVPIERPAQSSDLELPEGATVGRLEPENPIERDAAIYGREACSGTDWNQGNSGNWWSALFDASYQVQLVELLPMDFMYITEYDYAAVDWDLEHFLEGAIIKVGQKECYHIDLENSHTDDGWIQFECHGDGVTGATITLEQDNPAHPMSICGIKVWGNLDPRALLDREYADYTYDHEYENERLNRLLDERGTLHDEIEDLE